MNDIIEQTVLNMLDKLEIDNVAGVAHKKYVVYDPDHMLPKHLFTLYSETKNPNKFSIIRNRCLEFTIYNGSRMAELCKEKNDFTMELAVVLYLHHKEDLTLTFKNLSFEEPFYVATTNYSVGRNIKKETHNQINCKFINCVFEKTNFKKCHDIGRIEIEDCIIKNES